MHINKLLAVLFTTLFIGNIQANPAVYFDSIKKDPDKLYLFLKAMPKGGELHYHLAGGAYPQVMLQLAKQDPKLCLDLTTNSVKTKEQTCEVQTSGISQTKIYQRLLQAWSMIGFRGKTERSNHDHFFGAFFKFMPIVSQYRSKLLQDVVERAADHHEHYLEIMILPDNAASTTFAPKKVDWQQLEAQRLRLLSNPAFLNNITLTVDQANQILLDSRRNLNCRQNPDQDACQIVVRFQYYVLREQPIEKVFAQAVNAFEAVNRKGPFVGVNLVQPEDGKISMRDYRKQMAIFQYLHQVYPDVHISLHAGELSDKLVSPVELRSHIHDAIKIGHAERIGHGVDILHEKDKQKILRSMRINEIAVEINLTSNETILGIESNNHPLRHYLETDVPVVLSTDDEGILQTNLSKQYWLAATKYHLDYPTLKQINRNALTYSFLPGKSIWLDAKAAKPVKSCENLASIACQRFVAQNPKAAQQRLLELALFEFEQKH